MGDYNRELLKTSNKVVCPRCNNITPRETMKWVGYVVSPYCFAVCNKCYERYQKNFITRLLVKKVS